MQIIADQFYHVYNQGNNQEIIFRERADYALFLRKFRDIVLPNCGEVLAYCLMPNHFHFMINTNEKSAQKIKLGGILIDNLTNGFRKLLSEYASLFNEKYQRSGSLFRQKTKGKNVENKDENYPFICFHYIHQNPYKANSANRTNITQRKVGS